MQTAIPCCVMRGGTSKGLYFLADELPPESTHRDHVLLAAIGSPDPRQIDGMGGAHPLTSKIAVVSLSERPDADVDYLFLQAGVDRAEISDSQNCGNLLAAVGQFALENGLVDANPDTTDVRIHMRNTGSIAIARICTPGGQVSYEGDARIDGVPGTAAPVMLDFLDIAGSSCGALMPSGNVVDVIDGVRVTCIDNGMPVAVMAADDFGLSGYESPDELEANSELKQRIASIRLQLGSLMNLGDVTDKTVPKMSLVSAPRAGGQLCTRTFIPHRVHEAIGVLGAVSVATACVIPGSVAQEVTGMVPTSGVSQLEIEHPTGAFTVEMDVNLVGGKIEVRRAALLRTARLLMRGTVMVPRIAWETE